jgi:DNA-binding transcriptional LysR family regulator
MLLALPRNHRLLKGKPGSEEAQISWRDLAAEPFLMNRSRHLTGAASIFANLLSAWQQAGFTPNIVAEPEGMGSVINLVAAGVGVSIVPATMRSAHADEVVYCRIKGLADLRAPVTIIYLDSNNNPAAKNFIAIAHKEAVAFKDPKIAPSPGNRKHEPKNRSRSKRS